MLKKWCCAENKAINWTWASRQVAHHLQSPRAESTRRTRASLQLYLISLTPNTSTVISLEPGQMFPVKLRWGWTNSAKYIISSVLIEAFEKQQYIASCSLESEGVSVCYTDAEMTLLLFNSPLSQTTNVMLNSITWPSRLDSLPLQVAKGIGHRINSYITEQQELV